MPWADLALLSGSSAQGAASMWELSGGLSSAALSPRGLFYGFSAAGQLAFRREGAEAASPLRGEACSLLEDHLCSFFFSKQVARPAHSLGEEKISPLNGSSSK